MQQRKFRFTKARIDALPFSSGGNDRPEYRDEELPGLVIRVSKTAKTYYFIWFNKQTKRQEKRKLGNHLELIPHTARLRAMELLTRNAGGNTTRHANEVDQILVKTLADKFREEHVKKKLKDVIGYERQLDNYIIPLWGDRTASSLERKEIRAYLKLRTEESPTQSDKLLVVLSSMFTWGMKEELVESNPCWKIGQNGSNRRTRILSDKEIVDFVTALNTVEPIKRHYLWLLLLLAQRRGETCAMRWAHFHTKPGVWTLPREITKNGHAHSIPLPPLAKAHIKALQKETGEADFCFYSWERRHNREPGPLEPTYMTEFLGRFRKLNMPDWVTFTLHDLRRTAATNISSIVKDRAKVKLILNHVNSADVTGIYDLYSYDDVKLDALTRWEKRVRLLVPKKTIDLSLSS